MPAGWTSVPWDELESVLRCRPVPRFAHTIGDWWVSAVDLVADFVLVDLVGV